MKAIDILTIISREPVNSNQFGVIRVDEPMDYADFIRCCLFNEYVATDDDRNRIISGDVFYCWSDWKMDFPNSKDVTELKINSCYIYIIELE